MTVETMQTLSLVLYLLAGASLILAAVLFFVFKIPRILGDLSGASARKAIENIRKQNVDTGALRQEQGQTEASESRTTAKMTRTGRLTQRDKGIGKGYGTEKLSNRPAAAETALLSRQGEETTFLTNHANETVLLASPANETTVLSPSDRPVKTPPDAPTYGETSRLCAQEINNEFSVLTEIHFTASSEWIE